MCTNIVRETDEYFDQYMGVHAFYLPSGCYESGLSTIVVYHCILSIHWTRADVI